MLGEISVGVAFEQALCEKGDAMMPLRVSAQTFLRLLYQQSCSSYTQARITSLSRHGSTRRRQDEAGLGVSKADGECPRYPQTELDLVIEDRRF